MDTLNKSWDSPCATLKKYLSRLMTYNLSQELNRQKFETVYEGSLDVYNPSIDEPDVVIYSRKNEFSPVVALEICNRDEAQMLTFIARRLMNKYHLKEFFIFDIDTPRWYRLGTGNLDIDFSTVSDYLHLDMKDILYQFPNYKTSSRINSDLERIPYPS